MLLSLECKGIFMRVNAISNVSFKAMPAGVKFIKPVVITAAGKAAEQLGCEKGVKSACFVVDTTKIKAGETIQDAIKRGVTAMKTAEAQGRYRDISNEVL